MENKKLKLAFIGGGLNSIAGYPHFVASQMDNRFKVVTGFFSRNEDINRKTAEYWGIDRYYCSFDELLTNEKNNVDAFVVLSPTPTHFEYVYKLLEENIPVICEKPLFSSLDEMKKLESSITNLKDKFLVITYNYLGYPVLKAIKEFINDGKLGKIFSFNFIMPQESFLLPPKKGYPPKWRKKDGKVPTIALDLASHLFSLLKFLLDRKVISVKSLKNSYSSYKVVDDIKAIVELENNISGILWVSKIALGNKNGMSLEIYGSKGSIKWIQESPEGFIFSDNKGKSIIYKRGAEELNLSEKIFNRMSPGHPSGFIEAFANIYFYIWQALNAYKEGKDFRISPYIWDFYKEKENFKFLEML